MSTITVRSIRLHSAGKAALAGSDGASRTGTEAESGNDFPDKAHQRQRQVAYSRWENEGGTPPGRLELRAESTAPAERDAFARGAGSTRLPKRAIALKCADGAPAKTKLPAHEI